MTDSVFLHHFTIGATAAAAFEVLRVYEHRHTLSARKYTRLMRSKAFWSITIGMIAASGFFAWVFYAERAAPRVAELAVAGVAARALVLQGTAALTARKSIDLGRRSSTDPRNEDDLSLRDLLR